jgi:hypothetical protein
MKTVTAELRVALDSLLCTERLAAPDDELASVTVHEAKSNATDAREAIERALDLIQTTRCDVVARMEQF